MEEYYLNISYHEDNHTLLDSSFWKRGFLTSANVGIFLCICGTFLNFTQIVLLLGSPVLRRDYLYMQILNVAVADLGYVVTVDSFTVYYELQQWSLGVAFCKAWMLLDVALPYVSLIAILLLNADRIFFTYETRSYTAVMSRPLSRATVILFPWCISAVVVCTLWLGFSVVEPDEFVCMYGISKEASTASTWLTVFMPAIVITILLVFVFIAAIGEIPSQSMLQNQNGFTNRNNNNNNDCGRASEQGWIAGDVERSREGLVIATWSGGPPLTRHYRRFIAALLVVDFVTLTLTLPFPAFVHIGPTCNKPEGCPSLVYLFQTLSWMRSSVVCVRPLFFTVLTDIRQSCVRQERRTGNRRDTTSGTEETRDVRERSNSYRTETVRLTRIVDMSRSCHVSRHDECTTSTVALTPPNSPRKIIETKSDEMNGSNAIINSFT